MQEKRMNRINSELQKEIYNAIKKVLGEKYKGALISVQRVNVTEDLLECKVYISVFTINEQYSVDLIFDDIKFYAKEIREHVAHNIRLRYMPKLIFLKDQGEENAAKVGDILNEIKKQEK